MILTVGGVTALSWKAPALASSLMAGAPNLGVGDVAQTAMTGVAAGVAVAGFASGNPAVGMTAATRAAAGATQGAPTLGASSASMAGAAGGASAAGPVVAKASSSLVRSVTA